MSLEIIFPAPDLVGIFAARVTALVHLLAVALIVHGGFVSIEVVTGCESVGGARATRNFACEWLLVAGHVFSKYTVY